MRIILTSAVVAAIVGGIVAYALADRMTTSRAADMPAPAAVETAADGTSAGQPAASPGLRISDALPEDVWIDASRTAGADHRTLTDADNSICFITKIELGGIQSPDDTSSCVMQVDEFTGYWDLVATVDEGGQSSVRCNARCLIWE